MNDRQPERPGILTFRKVWRRDWLHPFRPGPLAFAPSGEHIAVGSNFSNTYSPPTDSVGALKVYDATNGNVLHQSLNDWLISPIAYSLDGRQLLTTEHWFRDLGYGGLKLHVRVLDGETFLEQSSFSIETFLYIPITPVFSPDRRFFANDSTELFVFDLTNGIKRWRVSRYGAGVAWSPDSASVAVGWYQDGSTAFAVFDALSGDQRVVGSTPAPVRALAFSPDSRWIVVGTESETDCAIIVVDADKGEKLWEVRQAEAVRVSSVTVSADGRWVAAFSLGRAWEFGLLGVYDLADGRPRFPPVRIEESHRLRESGPVTYSPTLRHVAIRGRHNVTIVDTRSGLEFARIGPGVIFEVLAPDGDAIAVGMSVNLFASDGVVEMYDLGIEVSRYAIAARSTAVATSPTGTSLVAVGGADNAVTVIDAASGVRLARKPGPGSVSSIVFADHGQAIAVGGGNGVLLFSVVGTRDWTVDGIGSVNALAVSGAAGEWIATAAGRTVRLLSSADGQSRWPSPTTHPHSVTRLAASADGNWIATGCLDRITRILNARDGTATPTVEGTGRVRDLAFAPNGALVATANEDGLVVLIDAATASEQSRIRRNFACSRVAFSADGALLATAWEDNDNSVSIFDLSTVSSPQEILRLALTAPVSGLAFNPAEPTVAVATEGASVVLYNASDGLQLARILQPAPVGHFAFSGDGAVIATASDDGIVRVWTSGLPASDVSSGGGRNLATARSLDRRVGWF